jgi:hypothetical protein
LIPFSQSTAMNQSHIHQIDYGDQASCVSRETTTKFTA